MVGEIFFLDLTLVKGITKNIEPKTYNHISLQFPNFFVTINSHENEVSC